MTHHEIQGSLPARPEYGELDSLSGLAAEDQVLQLFDIPYPGLAKTPDDIPGLKTR